MGGQSIMHSSYRPSRAALLLLAAGAASAACGRSHAAPPAPPPPEVVVHTVRPEAVTLTMELPGRTVAVTVSEVRPQINGIIQKRLFTEGQEVAAGQVLYQIDPALYQAAYDSAKANLAQAEASLFSARLLAERYAELVETEAVSRQQNDDAQAALQAGRGPGRRGARRARHRAHQPGVHADHRARRRPRVRVGLHAGRAGDRRAGGRAHHGAPARPDPRGHHAVERAVGGPAAAARERPPAPGGRRSDRGAVAPRGRQPLRARGHPGLHGRRRRRDHRHGHAADGVPEPACACCCPGQYVHAVVPQGVDEAALLVPQRGVTRGADGEATALVVPPTARSRRACSKTERTSGDRWVVTEGLRAGDRVIVEGLQKVRPGRSRAHRRGEHGDPGHSGQDGVCGRALT